MNEYLRHDLKALKPYKVHNLPYKIKLDANESPYDLPELIREQLARELLQGSGLNLYPDSDACALREAIAKYCGVSAHQIIVGAGSDELIRIVITAFVGRGEAVLCPYPSFGMYSIFTRIAGGVPVEIPLKDNFNYDIEAFFQAIKRYNPRLIFICSPNNPTGNVIDTQELMNLLEIFDGVVAVDEAYGEFCGHSLVNRVTQHPNGMVLKTFSKAFGLAGLRIGYLIGNKDLVEQIYKVKPPYNVNSFSQRAAQLVLENIDVFRGRISTVIEERERLYDKLCCLEQVQAYPSKANFILIKVPDGERAYQKLVEEGILVRNFPGHADLKDHLRVTVGTREDNDIFIQKLKLVLGGV